MWRKVYATQGLMEMIESGVLGPTSMKAAVWLGQDLTVTRLHSVSPPPQEHFPLQSLFHLRELASATGRELAVSWRERSGCADHIQVFS